MRTTILLLCLVAMIAGCGNEPQSFSGVRQATVAVATQSDGFTIEQQNIRGRLLEDNKPGAIKHLYVISAYSGQVIIYSTVKGKVTSGGKRLSPSQISGNDYLFRVDLGGGTHYTSEVLQDDGTYGQSDAYLYWWDTKGVYHQHYVSGGQIIHVSDQPLAVKSIILNLNE
jgi:hypothetical protein